MDRDKLLQALQNAHAAGDTAAAQRIAGIIKSMPQDAPQAAATQDPMLPSPDTDTRSTQEYLRDTGQLPEPTLMQRAASTAEDVGRSAVAGATGAAEFVANVPAAVDRFAREKVVSPLAERIFTPERVGRFAVTPEISAAMEQQSVFPELDADAIGEMVGAGPVTEYEPKTTPGDYAKTLGEFSVGGAMARAPWIMGTLLPALGSETAGQVTEGTSAEPFARIAGALAAPVAAQTAQRIISPMAGRIDPSRAAAADVLQREGVNPTAGQVAGPVAGQNQLYREASTAVGRQAADDAAEQFTGAALRTVGANAPRATPDVLEEATRRIGSVFDDAIQGVRIAPTAQNATRLQTVVDQAQDLTATGLPRLFERIGQQVDDAVRTGQPVRPEVARTWRSNLSALTKNSDQGVRSAAIDALEVVDDIIENSLVAAGRPEAVQALSTARRQYRNLLAIERAAMRAEDGILSPQALRTALLGQSRRQYTQNQGDLAPLTRAANELLKPLPNSGTSQRNLAAQLTANSPSGGAAGLGAFGLGMDPATATAVGAVATAAPAIRNQIMSLPIGQRYFLNQLLPQANVTPRMIAGMLTGEGSRQGPR